MKEFLQVAEKAIKAAGKILIKNIETQNLKISKKAQSDYVTNIDYISEETIIKFIQKEFPHHIIYSEEKGKSVNNNFSEYTWIIDPLDGTTNYLHRYPTFSISIALAKKNKIILGVVYDPIRDEIFTAIKGKGAYLNNKRIRVSNQKNINDALLTTGFPFRHKHILDTYLECFRRLFLLCGGIRRTGSAALDLAYTSCGRCDGFFEYGLSIWDIAAGALLVEEAGGVITDFFNQKNHLNKGDVVAGNYIIHKEIVKITSEVFKNERESKKNY
jgi:myo-inositol-1(or 4)-monophosphatase